MRERPGVVYQVESLVALIRTRRARRAATVGVGQTVVLLGLTSLFTDISSEMVATILPVYLVGTLSLSPIQFGVIDGLYQGAAAVVRLVGGFTADRWRRHKEVAASGYGLSAACKLGYLAAGSSVPGLGAVVFVDRAGKGIRTAPRDALIALSSPPAQLGTAFGVHRGLDTAGAMLGPLVAFGLLELAPGSFDPIFVVSFCFAILGLGILTLFVRNRPLPVRSERRLTVGAALGVFRLSRFRRLVIAGSLLGVATISDAFVYLGLQRNLEFRTSVFPLLFVGTALMYMVLAIPVGRLADRVGRGKVFVTGYAILALVYTSLLLPDQGTPMLLAYLALFGAFYAATDGVLMAMAASILPEDAQASGMALLLTAVGLARLLASVIFGALWTSMGLEQAVTVYLVALGFAVVAAAVVLRGPGRVARA